MKNTMEYKGYVGSVEFSEEDGIFFGKVMGIRSLISYEGTDARSLVEIDEINGVKSYMDVDITKVSLSLMRVRDKGYLQGTIVPVWDFWGTYDWYWQDEDDSQLYMKKGANVTTEPMLTLNAVDGNVVSRLFGY